MDRLDGKRAFVTGGTRGLGFAVVERLAGLGADVHFTGRSDAGVAAARARLGCPATGHVCDMQDRERLQDILGGPWDILINNASVGGQVAPFHEADPAAWSEAVAINLTGAADAARAALPGLQERGGTVVNVSTGAAHRAIPGSSAYCVSKAGLAMLTKVLHEEYGPRGLRVFGFGPGVMKTDMHLEVRAHYEGVFASLEDVDGPETAADAIAFLCGAGGEAFRGREFNLMDEGLRAAMAAVSRY